VFDREREADASVDSVRCVVSRDGPVVFAWCLLGKHDRLGVRTESARVWTERQKRKSVPGTFLSGTLTSLGPRRACSFERAGELCSRGGDDLMLDWLFRRRARVLTLPQLVDEGASCLEQVSILGTYRMICSKLDGGSSMPEGWSEVSERSVHLSSDAVQRDVWMEQWKGAFSQLMEPVAEAETRPDQARALRRALLDMTDAWCLTGWLVPDISGDRLDCSSGELENLRRQQFPDADGPEELALLAARDHLVFHLSLVAVGGIALRRGALPDQEATNRYTVYAKTAFRIALMKANDDGGPPDQLHSLVMSTFDTSLRTAKEQIIDGKKDADIDWGGLTGLGE
jgi:hypothetical protein